MVQITKLGTIDCDTVETTPIVFKGRLYRFEYIRSSYHANTVGMAYFQLVDVATGERTPPFAFDCHFGSAHVEGERVYVYGVPKMNGPTMQAFWSEDLEHWSTQTALRIPGWGMFNNSVCSGPSGYIMAIELGEPEEEVGVGFTMRFARSDDLVNWTPLPRDRVFSKDRYTACPVIRFWEGHYYMIYLEAFEGPQYNPYIVRSSDLVHWETSPHNPVMHYSDEDKAIANPDLTEAQRQVIASAVNRNNSDVDLCEFEGHVEILYSWGDQVGNEFLAAARYDGTLAEFFRAFFPE